jgi:hypothetical protein
MYSKVLYNSVQLVIYKDTLTVGNRIEGPHWRSMGFTPGVIPQPGFVWPHFFGLISNGFAVLVTTTVS